MDNSGSPMQFPMAISLAAALLASALSAKARDLGADEAGKLHQAGIIVAQQALDQAALSLHPGARVLDRELELHYGRYLYQVELLDTQGRQWQVELDASSARILKNHQDD